MGAGAQCQAAQGRVNAEDLTVIQGPQGCLAPDMSGASETEPGTPVVLHSQRCTHGVKKLLCTERIAELERGTLHQVKRYCRDKSILNPSLELSSICTRILKKAQKEKVA